MRYLWIILVMEKLGDNPLPYPYVAATEAGALEAASRLVTRLTETGRITIWSHQMGGMDCECVAALNHRGERL